VGLAPTNGSFQDFVTTMRDLVGDRRTLAWLRAMERNGARTYDNNTAILEAVARGEIELGLVNHYYNEQAKREDPGATTENHFFDAGDPGGVILTTGIGVLDTAGSRRDDAERLVAFLLSDEAQEYFATETLEYPLAGDVPAPAGIPALRDVRAPTIDLSDLGGGLTRTRELIRDSGLERA
jgi:iron(III) transport system substrate-binding protein